MKKSIDLETPEAAAEYQKHNPYSSARRNFPSGEYFSGCQRKLPGLSALDAQKASVEIQKASTEGQKPSAKGQKALRNRYPDPFQRDLKKRIAQLSGFSKKCCFSVTAAMKPLICSIGLFAVPGADRAVIMPGRPTAFIRFLPMKRYSNHPGTVN